MVENVTSDQLREADHRTLRDHAHTGALTRFFYRATADYRRALSDDLTRTLLLTAVVVLGIPMGAEAIALGMAPAAYLSLTMGRIGRASAWAQEMRAHVIRELLPWIAFVYLVQPCGYNMADLQGMKMLELGNGREKGSPALCKVAENIARKLTT